MATEEMAKDEREIAFSDALQKLVSEDQVPIHLLYELSDLNEDQMREFELVWPTCVEDRRHEIIRHLVDISEEDFLVNFQELFAYCMNDPNPDVRTASLDGFWDATDLNLIDPIIKRMESDPVGEVQAAAAGALAHFLLMSAWGELCGVPTDVIIEALLAAFNKPESHLALRRVALEALGSVNLPEISKAIEESYESPDRAMQLSALFAMGNSADPRWLPIVLDEMESPYEEMRQEAARAAGNIGDSEAISRLAELAYDESEDVAQAAIEALGEIGGAHVHEILLDMFDDPDLENMEFVIEQAIEDASRSTMNLKFGFLSDDYSDDFMEEEE
jgi:HEAT repeat protein